MEKWSRSNYTPNLPLGSDGRRVTASAEHIAVSKNAALEGMVLLKNDGILPIRRGAKVALFGKGTFDYVKGGGGSGDVHVPYIRDLSAGFALYPELVTVFPETDDYYRKYVHHRYAEGFEPGLMDEPELPDELVRRAAAFADTAVISISRFSGEGWDRKCAFDTITGHKGVWEEMIQRADRCFPKGDFVLTDAEETMIAKVKSAFSRVAVVLNVGSVFDTSWIKNDPAIGAALIGWQAGLEGGAAEAELLLGIANPSGKLADTFAATLEDYPSSPFFYTSDDYVDYEEDIYVGYRYFETIPGQSAKVNYPFGFGLSYTEFTLKPAKVSIADGVVSVKTTVTNTGRAAGKEVVQVYFSAPQGKLGRPERELAGWQKTRLLMPGEKQTVVVRFPVSQMAAYDDLGKVCASARVLEKGEYRFFAGTDVRSAAPAKKTFVLEKDAVVEQLKPRMTPELLRRRMLSDGSYEELPTREPNDPNANALEPLTAEKIEGIEPAVRFRPNRNRRQVDPRPKLIDVAEGKIGPDEFIAAMTDEELAILLGGQPNTGLANTFGYGNLPDLGVPNVMTADGPAGLRVVKESGVRTTAFPCACLLACTWDPEVTEAVGRAAGAEVKENNIGVWLAPAINIHRNPLCGRNFEYFSEDPLLTGHLAGALIRGVQSNGVAATAKHLALNNKETNRKNSDSRASERAIREIYLRAFEIVVKEYDVWSIMTSYNIINGCRASENDDMLNGILREEWGYEGLVTTDWWTWGEHYKECAAGNDVKMGTGYPERLLEAWEKGALTRADLELAARHVLGLILKVD